MSAKTNDTGFLKDLFQGRFSPSKIHPFSSKGEKDSDEAEAFLQRLQQFLNTHVDANEIDATGEIPQNVLDGLKEIGTFGIKVPREYDGLDLSQFAYVRAMTLLGSCCGSISNLISIHQAVGITQPLMLFGTPEQKEKFIPPVASGMISAFAVTEKTAGSDPASMQTRAEFIEEEDCYVLNGEKIWCTNAVKAGMIIVTAKTPSKIIDGKEKEQVTAFVLDMTTPGVEVLMRCRFMGLKALYNGVLRFTDVKIPRGNVIAKEGMGLKVALTTLNAARLSAPAVCLGISKRALTYTREWASERIQGGRTIGQYGMIAEKIRQMAANVFAMESLLFATCSVVDRDKFFDIRSETAMTKMWMTEANWRNIDHAMQIRGGRGFETAQSQAARGEKAMPIERMMRDSRITTIYEGSSEIMRLLTVREALTPYLRGENDTIPSATEQKKNIPQDLEPELQRYFTYVVESGERLALKMQILAKEHGDELFHKKQMLLSRIADIGAELYAISASCARAQQLIKSGKEKNNIMQLVADFYAQASQRIEDRFSGLEKNTDDHGYQLTQDVLEGQYSWLESGIA